MKYLWLFLCFSAPLCIFSQVLNDSCRQAVELFCGDVLWVDLNEASSLTPEFFVDCEFRTGKPGVWYKLVGTGDFIHFSSCNDYSLNIQVFEGTCDTLICMDPIANFPYYQCDLNEYKEVAFRSEVGKTYYIYCRSNSALTFGRLSVACYAPLPNDICSQAKPIILDSTYAYDHRVGTPSDHNSCLDSYYRTLPDSWYTFQGNGGYVQVDNFSGNLLTSCLIKEACNSLEFVESGFISGDRAYLTEAGVAYFLQIVNTNLQPAYFRLRTFYQADNDDCSGARFFPLEKTFSLTFDSTLASIKACTVNEGTYDRWYYFTGNDSVVTFSWNPYTSFTGTRIKVLTGTCDSLVCETLTQATNEVSVPTIVGKRYWVNIHNSNAYEFDTPVSVSSIVTAPLANDKYTGAITLACGDTLQGTLAYALEDQSINGYSNSRSVWYKVTGSDEFYSVTTRNAYRTIGFIKRFYALQNGNLVAAPITSPTYTYLKKDSTYFLNIHGIPTQYDVDFEIFLTCHPVDENDICEDALPVSVADTTYGRIGFTTTSTFDYCSSYGTKPDIWYQFTGDGRLKELVFENLLNNQTFALFKGTCDTLSCITSWFNYFEEPFTSRQVLLDKGEQFFLKVQDRSSKSNDQEFRFYFRDLGIACPEENPAYQDTIKLSGSHLQDQIFDAGHLITSNAKLESPNKVLYRAGEKIVLLPGFHANPGIEFNALTWDCLRPSTDVSFPSDQPDLKLLKQKTHELPSKPLMLEIFPNPLSQTATLRFYLPEAGYANLRVYDLRGIRLSQFLNEYADQGWNTSIFDGSKLPNGKYLISLYTPFGIYNKLIVVIK